MNTQLFSPTLTIILFFFQTQLFAQEIIFTNTPIRVTENIGSAEILPFAGCTDMSNSCDINPQQLMGLIPNSAVINEQNNSNLLSTHNHVNSKAPAILPQNSQMLDQKTNSPPNSEDAVNLSPYISGRAKAVSVTDAFSNASSCMATYSYATMRTLVDIPGVEANAVLGVVAVTTPIH